VSLDLIEQGAGLGAVIHVVLGQWGGHDPARVGVHAQMQLLPGPACSRVLSGRSAVSAFAAVKQHPVLIDAMKRGAEVVMLPHLACMSQVTDRGLKFTEAANGGEKPGQEPLSFFDQERVAIWWERDIPSFFGRMPALWLPAVKAGVEVAHA
jgi:hypothetical protein